LFNADNGQNITDPLDTGSPVSSSPVIFNNNIILAGEDGRVWVLDTGKNILSQLTDKSLGKIYAPLSISNGIIYVHTQSNMLYAVKADTGVVLWNKSLAG
jgi:outer membrane protein assembly factor BamB